MSMIAKNRTKSTWTPLSNEETNNQIFEERRVLINKWFDKWTHDQRKHIMEDLIHKAKIREKGFIRDYVKEHVPALKRDFTRHLPRVISIYIFSFLDPRSLCRAGQVCWYWKYLTDLDQLWMLKCVKLGWNLPVMPGQYETGKSTKIDLSKIVPQQKPPKSAKSGKSTPWRGSDPVPKDTWRYNYLENNDVVQDVKTMRRRKDYAPEGKEKIVTTSQDHLNNWDGFTMSMTMPPDASMGVTRPAPVHSHPRPTKRQQVSARTPRDPPSTDLFPKQPWKVGNKEESDEEL
ncbi:FBX16-like protein [Mya arenaria]|uniref:FBX16-like protein n=1 Tax=Mya arenaria TaxID=6604 RepID=A0ABY7F4H1_MYAAR|nr:FBX16-like protein [Mya arenaria]